MKRKWINVIVALLALGTIACMAGGCETDEQKREECESRGKQYRYHNGECFTSTSPRG